MKVLGNSLHIANSGKLIARSSKTPSPGGIVFNSDKTKIGKVSYVFGPTKSPYVSIKLFKSANLDKIKRNYGEKLFVSRPKSKKPRKRRVKTRNKKKTKSLKRSDIKEQKKKLCKVMFMIKINKPYVRNVGPQN